MQKKYRVKDVIPTKLTDEEFVQICKQSFKESIIIYLFFIGISAALLIVLFFFAYNGVYYHLLTVFTLFSMVPSVMAFSMILGANPYEPSFVQEYLNCKSFKDWITYAERRDCISHAAIISKKITSENRKIVELCLDPMELRYFDEKFNVMRALSLKESYQKDIRFLKKKELKEDEAVIDLSGKEVVIYLKNC
ncbi:Uncharacterised protein [Anaerostipes hadrus]|uniref:Uncharacterized protein n=1 Tax=Anaerostipes hadrus TaxID=649756 RepID=A0A174JGC2_ANAHA|nr:hypothetical protein [Anaerostipes hadrus]CUO96957.1 Uncharacterised protein [Anaerostipes hadrus]